MDRPIVWHLIALLFFSRNVFQDPMVEFSSSTCGSISILYKSIKPAGMRKKRSAAASRSAIQQTPMSHKNKSETTIESLN
mmetsp:Transcript_2630/g.5687  ORF Transcript_2630/g.5687 Transcript_2630/m.5687 type:complete len:80 (+) Transcript_2630:219-458(+)